MPNDLRIAAAQFENRSGDKAFNLATIAELAAKAARQGAHAIAFHECSITGYGFARHLSKEQLRDLAEAIPDRAGHWLTPLAGKMIVAGGRRRHPRAGIDALQPFCGIWVLRDTPGL